MLAVLFFRVRLCLCSRIYNLMSVLLQNFKVLECKIFAQESTCLKGIVLKQSCDELWFVKKCYNPTFKVNFLCQKLRDFFQKKIITEYQLRRPFFVKNILFQTSIFEQLYFLKSCPIFDKLALPIFSEYNGFL